MLWVRADPKTWGLRPWLWLLIIAFETQDPIFPSSVIHFLISFLVLFSFLVISNLKQLRANSKTSPFFSLQAQYFVLPFSFIFI